MRAHTHTYTLSRPLKPRVRDSAALRHVDDNETHGGSPLHGPPPHLHVMSPRPN